MANELEHALLQMLLEKELVRFRRTLDGENPGLSEPEIERYMRAATLFANQLTGSPPRTRGRQLRSAKSAKAAKSAGEAGASASGTGGTRKRKSNRSD